jgi:hypothetical protein
VARRSYERSGLTTSVRERTLRPRHDLVDHGPGSLIWFTVVAFGASLASDGAVKNRTLVFALVSRVCEIGLVMSTIAADASAQTPPHEDVTELAKATQNPVGDLVSVPFQFNFKTGGDYEDRTLFTLNFQPVIPFKLTSGWALIARPIVPITSVPGSDGARFSGVGDIQAELFFTPAKPGAIIWGAGPVLSFPTATARPNETGTWALGPGVVIVKMTGPFVLGGLITQFWPMSDAGGDPETNVFVGQPFVNYNVGRGWAVSFAPEISANWDAPSGQQWTVPLGLGVTRTTVFNRRPMNIGVQYYYNVKRPDGAPAQTLRFVVSLLFPAAKK